MLGPDDLCPRPEKSPNIEEQAATRPMAQPIHTSSVWSCRSPDQANRILDGIDSGYVYQRERHPNGDALADKLTQLHAADWGEMTGAGMAALSAVLLGLLKSGSRIVASSRLYGTSLTLMRREAVRFGMQCDIADPCDLSGFADTVGESASLVVVETISNPNLRVADIPKLAEIAHQAGALLLVDNTFATPVFCRPMELGADLVMESVSKMINGHSDVMLGFIGGAATHRRRIHDAVALWGLNAPPFDCYLASRGLATLALRMSQATQTAGRLAEWLVEQPNVKSVDYPGLASHPDSEVAGRVLSRAGSMLAIHLAGGRDAADRFIEAVVDSIPFAPSLGEVSTTLSHPATTSHRSIGESERRQLGFDSGTIRLSVGVESPEYVQAAVAEGLAACR